METTNLNQVKNNLLNWKLTLKIVFIGVITIMLLIPKLMIISLIDERGKTAESARKEVMQKWSEAQAVRGPVLTVPVKEMVLNNDKNTYEEATSLCYFLPESLSINGTIQPRDRFRSIYRVVVYESEIKITGSFNAPDLSTLQLDPQNMQWDKAELSVAISDLRGISNIAEMEWNNKKYTFSPGMDKSTIGRNGITLSLPLDLQNSFPAEFTITLHLKGSQTLQFAPLGKVTTARLTSPWNDPGFTGNFLPTEHNITPSGFSADWKVLHFNRNFPQAWAGEKFNVTGSDFGVELVTLADHYQKNSRSAKYGILVILLIFLSFFLNEVITGERIHPIQYAMVGFSILVFYLLLLSISEHLGFNAAYLITSASVLLMVYAYSRTFVRKIISSIGLTTILAASFVFIFVLLQMETYALLTGSIGLFLILATTMYLTRKINWYNEQ